MRENQGRNPEGFTKAYESADTLLFLDESIECYKQMLSKDTASEKSPVVSIDFRTDRREKQVDIGHTNTFHCASESWKETEFRKWLEDTLKLKPTANLSQSRTDTLQARDLIVGEFSQTEANSRLDLPRRDCEYYQNKHNNRFISRRAEFRVNANRRQFTQKNSPVFESNYMNMENLYRNDNMARYAEAMLVNNDTSINSSCYSFTSPFCETVLEKSFDEDNIFENFPTDKFDSPNCSIFSPVSSNNGLKSRPGSWSDSGYCCDKSDTDHSRFSSLSFSDCNTQRFKSENAFNFDLPQERINQESASQIDGLSDKFRDLDFVERAADFSDSNSAPSANGYEFEDLPALAMFQSEEFNSEELNILRELVNNPDNMHETTKELSDISRDISSKDRMRKQFKVAVGKFFRKIVGNGKKRLATETCGEATRKTSEHSTSGHSEPLKEEGKLRKNISKSLKGFRKQSPKSILRKFGENSSMKSQKDSTSSFNNLDIKKIQRTSSYSSLFGQRGSLFSQIERSPAECRSSISDAKRSLSMDTLPMKCPRPTERKDNDLQSRDILFVSRHPPNCEDLGDDSWPCYCTSCNSVSAISCDFSQDSCDVCTPDCYCSQPDHRLSQSHCYHSQSNYRQSENHESYNHMDSNDMCELEKRYRKFDDCYNTYEMVAPLEVNVCTERAAFTRKVRKLRDVI
eukprot:Seg6395.2 transcript_id=Seg6395.2/GoldUCD/mRNA.D3Y31 product="hypothetical protein" protein_id=Seg6395.2/GoldUCD/D3Y31